MSVYGGGKKRKIGPWESNEKMDFWGSPFWPNARRVLLQPIISSAKKRNLRWTRVRNGSSTPQYYVAGRVQSCLCTTSIWRISHRIKASDRNSLDHNDDTLLYTAVHTAHTLLHILHICNSFFFFFFSKAIYLQYYRFSPGRIERAWPHMVSPICSLHPEQTCVCVCSAKGSRHK